MPLQMFRCHLSFPPKVTCIEEEGMSNRNYSVSSQNKQQSPFNPHLNKQTSTVSKSITAEAINMNAMQLLNNYN